MDYSPNFLALLAPPVMVRPVYIKITGRLTAGVLLSEIMYEFEEGVLVCPDAEMMERTGLTLTELKSAKRVLKAFGFCEIKAKGCPPITEYRPNGNQILAAISAIKTN